MKFSTLLEPVADEIYNLLCDNTPVNIPDYGWENYVWTSDKFAWAHLQKFATEKSSILHCVIMPHSNRNAPIFGFDVNELSGQLIGMYLDITPVNDQEYYIPRIGESRPRPDWATFFSTHFVCAKPQCMDDVWHGIDILKGYLQLLPGGADGDYTEAQRRYTQGQKKNPHTHRMLKKFIGAEQATEYIETVLFPDPN